jgi:hypothetical protein
MKVHVLFNDAGEVGAIFHPKAGKDHKFGFRPKEGQISGILDIPAELEHLAPRALHECVRVVTIGGEHRLVCKA